MIRARTLHGRSVVDLEAAEKLGAIEDVLLDPEGGRVAGFVVGEGRAPGAGGKRWVLPAGAVYALGKDAVTIQGGAGRETDVGDEGALPRLSKLIGHKMITEGGTVLGAIEDVLLDDQSGAIAAYAFQRDAGPASGLGALLGGNKPQQLEYLRAGRGIRVGKDLIIVPDDAEVGGEPVSDDLERGVGVPAHGTRVDWSGRGATAEREGYVVSSAPVVEPVERAERADGPDDARRAP